LRRTASNDILNLKTVQRRPHLWVLGSTENVKYTIAGFGCILCVYGGKNPWADWSLFFSGGRHPRHNHVFQIWWRSVQGFRVGWGSNFAIPHWLWRSSLQHYHTK